MSFEDQIEFIKSLMETAGESAKPKFNEVLESLYRLKDLCK